MNRNNNKEEIISQAFDLHKLGYIFESHELMASLGYSPEEAEIAFYNYELLKKLPKD